VVVRDEIGQGRRSLACDRRERVEVPALGAQGDGCRAGTHLRDGEKGIRVGGAVHEHPVTRVDQAAQDEGEAVLCAAGDQDLVGVGRQAPAAVTLGDPGPQLGKTEQLVAWAGQIRWQSGDRGSHRVV
jgi:hypothetical protein